MTERRNLADPEYEPTDEDLQGLAREAFAHVRGAHERALSQLRDEIAVERAEVLARIRRAHP